MNNITIAGQLGRDAELRALPDGTQVLNFSVADSQGRDKPTIWWNCQLFGKRAASLQQYLMKGQAVTVAGNVSEREWRTKEGEPKKSMEIRVNDVALQGGQRQQSEAPPAPRAAPRPAPAPKASAGGGSGFDDMDSDIPFRDPLAYRGAHLAY
jgi:single-strand DNA-binding protein